MKPVSVKYAKALFELAREAKIVPTIAKDLEVIKAMLLSEPDLMATLASPRIQDAAKESLIVKLWQSKVSPLTFHFMRFLVKRGRLNWFFEIQGVFVGLTDEMEGRARGTAVVMNALEESDLKKLEKGFSEFFGRHVELRQRVDPAVLGGVAIHVDHEVFDGTVRRRLADIKSQLLAIS